MSRFADLARRLGARFAAAAGTATLETALVGGILVTMALGVVEFGNAFSAKHTVASLSREGANLAARGTTLGESIAVVLENGADLGLASRGGAIASRLEVDDGTATVEEQVASSGYAGQSRMAGVGQPVPEAALWGLREGQIIYVMEVYYNYEAVTPFTAVTKIVVPSVLYERAIF
jgi:hypothetical protein